MKKETFKRRIRKITAFAAAVAMAVTVTMPGEIFGNIDFGITVFAEENGYDNGFCTTYTEENGCTNTTHTDCNGYQPATLTTDKYNIDGVEGFDEVYEIGNAGQLYWFAALVNGTNGLTKTKGANAVLTGDIIVNPSIKWTPIGNSSNQYTGTFDGDNKTISGLYFNDTGTSCVGLFDHVGSGGSVSNVGVENSYFKGSDNVGSVCGFNEGTITNCYNKGTVSGSDNVGGVCGWNESGTITNCYNTGKVSGSGNVGGVCGVNKDGIITNCYNTGEVSGTGYCTGGVCGWNISGTITNCYNTGSVSGEHDVGGVCGLNEGTIENNYNEGTVSGTDYVGGVCGDNRSTISNCYFLEGKASIGIGSGSGSAESKTEEQFKNGSVCYLLNNGTTNGTQVWYQTLDSEAYPNLDTTNKESRTVYACNPCTGVFSNTSGQTAQHTFAVDTENGKQHKCEKCGETHNAEFTVNDTTDTISVCCDLGSVTLKAPTENLTYDGTAKAATVEGELTGIDTPKILYNLKGSAEAATDTAPTNAGTYVASITYTDADSVNHSVSVEYTIDKATPGGDINRNINVVRGVGTFTEPVFTGVDGQPLGGGVKYGERDYDQLVEYLKTLSNVDIDCSYEFTPDDVNYNNVTGVISFTFYDVVFKVGNDDATAENAVTVKANPTYGDTWAEILTLNTGLKAVLVHYSGNALYDSEVTTGFSLDVTGSPDAGNQTFKVFFNGTIGGKTFTDHVVATGTVDVAKKEIGNIVITDITTPAPKATLDTSAVTSTTGCTPGAVSWTDGDTSVTEAGFDKAYTAKVTVTADSNHTFGSSLTATVNGETASITKNADGTATVTFTFDKTAAAAVTGISINTPPTKTEYFVGENIDLTGAKITATYEDGNSKPVDITSDMISGFDSSTAGTNTVTVTYEGKTTTFNVTIKEPAVTGIRISTTPKTEYLIDDTLDVSGGEITVSYEYGDDKVISITSAMVTGFNSSAAVESQTLTVTYEEKTDTYDITVKKHTPSVTAPTASAITLGQTLAASTLSDNTWSWSDSSIQPTSAGTHSYTAVKIVSDADKYDYTALDGFTFNSSANTLTTNVSVVVNRVGASVTPPTASNTLTYGQALSAAGLTEGWTWESASTIPDVNNAGFTAYKIVTDYDNFDYSNLTGFVYDETAHKLSYKVAVTVNKATPTDATTASRSFTKGTASTVFAAPVFKGIDNAELTGSVSYTYGGQTYTTTAALNAALDLLDGGESGTVSYTFTPDSANYTTASGSITFSVIDAVVTGITLKSALTKTTYEIGDTLDLTGGQITVSYNNGTSIDIDITAEMTSGFDSTTAGEKTVTVTYGGKTTSFNVTIKPEAVDNEHTHSYDTNWSYDETYHWHECECGEKSDVSEHIEDSGTVTIEPTETTEGERTFKCEVCGYVIRTETIPVTEPSIPDDPAEKVNSFVERLYENVLGRPSDPSKESHIDNLNNGETATKVAYDFVFSPEFTELDISNEERVIIMYNTFLNRDPDPAGLETWTNALDNGCSIGHIFYGFTQSGEFGEVCAEYGIEQGTWEYTENRDKSAELTSFVSRLYTKALGRKFDVNGLNDHTGNYLENHDLYQMAYNFIFSPEFLSKELSDEDFVDTMYRTFFDREGDPDGRADWLGKLKSGCSREEVLAGFVYSQECADMVAKFGI